MKIQLSPISSPLAQRPACGCHGRSDNQPATPPPADGVLLSSKAVNDAPPEEGNPPPEDPPPPPPNVKVNVYAQDPFVNGPIVMEIEREKIGTNLSGERVSIQDTRALPSPDANGNFLLEPGSDGISQVNAHTVTYKTLELFEKYRGSRIPWAFRSDALNVVPHKQEGRNAYYSRWERSTNYFHFRAEALNTTVKTANSSDVVSHETGHAMLDGLRPGFFGTWDPETGAFHEAFGDCAAMLFNLEQASNRELIQRQSGGSLREHNALSSLAEEFGAGVKRDNDNPADDDKTYLRTALNSFTYVDPSELPPGRGDEDHLGREVHSFSRLFSAAFYDAIESVYMQSIYEDRQCPAEALKTAADVTGPLLVRAIESGSASQARFRQLALGMIAADAQLNGGKYSEGLKKVFIQRQIVSEEDFQEDELRRVQLPDVRLTGQLDQSNAVEFLRQNSDALGLPKDLPWKALSVNENDRGERFLSFNYAQETPVRVEGFEGYTADLLGSANLVFDSSGKLTDFDFSPIDVQNEMMGIAEMRDSNAIRTSDQEDIFNSIDGSLFKTVVQGKKLVRVPVSSCGHDHA